LKKRSKTPPWVRANIVCNRPTNQNLNLLYASNSAIFFCSFILQRGRRYSSSQKPR
jgi:hypothetical protein